MRARLDGAESRRIADAAPVETAKTPTDTPAQQTEHPEGGVAVDWKKLEIGQPMLRVRARVENALKRAKLDPALEQRAFENLESLPEGMRGAELELLAQAVGSKDPGATFGPYVELAERAKRQAQVFSSEVRTTLGRALERGTIDTEGFEDLVDKLTRIRPMSGKQINALLAEAGQKDGRTVLKTADVVEQRLQILQEAGAGYGIDAIRKFAQEIRGMTAEKARTTGEARGLFRALYFSKVIDYEASIGGRAPIDFVRDALAERTVPKRSDMVDTFADVPSVKRTLRRIEELQANGSIKEVVWDPYSPGGSSHWNARARQMSIHKEDILEMISTIAHETTHVPQKHFVYEPGMTREEFIQKNSKMMMNGEVQAFRVGAEMWRDFEAFGVERKDIPEGHREVLKCLEAEGVGRNERIRRLENYIAEELGYAERHRIGLGDAWDRTVGAGHPEKLERELATHEPPEQSRQGESTSGRTAAPIDPTVVEVAKKTHGLTDEEAQRFGRFAADLTRVRGMVESDPAAALRELFEAARAEPWKGLQIEFKSTNMVGEMTVASLYREIVAYEKPDDMTMVELAYAFGADEGAYRVQNGAYRGTRDHVEIPKNVSIYEPPEEMPKEEYAALVNGLREQHVYGIIDAFADAAGQRVKEGATISMKAPEPAP
ncbi:MAG: hypothetical protein RIT81_20750 [Deltaproteobacteria bacterium]